MPTTTPVHGLQVPVNGDTVEVPTDMLTLANGVDKLLPVSATSAPSPLPGLIWFNPTTGVTQVSDGANWYPFPVSASGKVTGATSTVTSTTSEVLITNWNIPATWTIGGITYSAGVFTVTLPGVYRASLTIQWPGSSGSFRNTQDFLVNGTVVNDGGVSYNTAAGMGSQWLTGSAEFQLAANGTIQAGLISTSGGVSGVIPVCFSVTRVA